MMKLDDSKKYKEKKEKDKLRKVLKENERSWSWRHYEHLQLLKQQ